MYSNSRGTVCTLHVRMHLQINHSRRHYLIDASSQVYEIKKQSKKASTHQIEKERKNVFIQINFEILH